MVSSILKLPNSYKSYMLTIMTSYNEAFSWKKDVDRNTTKFWVYIDSLHIIWFKIRWPITITS